MDVRTLLGESPAEDEPWVDKAYTKYGVASNPFPAIAQTSGHPRLTVPGVDERIVRCVQEFQRGDHKSQVFVIEGSQGVGKTNLLNNYQQELERYFAKDSAYYIIRYYPDPEPDFDRTVRKVFQELGESFLSRVISALAAQGESEITSRVGKLRSIDLRVMLRKMVEAQQENVVQDLGILRLAQEWLTGQRLLNRHKEVLGVQFRLDTVESRTQALHDVVFLAGDLEVLKGLFLLMDELEKQDGVLPERSVVQYLSAIRALIDGLSHHLFMILAITTDARVRYFKMVPAFASRLQGVLTIPALTESDIAFQLYEFYLKRARDDARGKVRFQKLTQGTEELFSRKEIGEQFKDLYAEEAESGFTGVTQRGFLGRLHDLTERKFLPPS